ncbi:translocation/assembly module TamB domain-containing protein [Zunongwangia sp.]|uniref:translocation/assembly module TamB domain-containing protein n=1 Tax=Zunongwangia sp. TaxID=1965325 RepID=UPI003AA84E92
MQNISPKIKKTLRIFLKIIAGIVVFLILLLLFIRSPWGQNIIVQRVVAYLEKETNTEIKIDKLFIAFDGAVTLEKLYVEETSGDTLLYANSLDAQIAIWPLIKGNAFGVNEVNLEGVKANIHREDSIKGYNFQFLIDAFATADTTQQQPTNSKPMEISVGDVYLKNIFLNFDDAVLGAQANLILGDLAVEMNSIDMADMQYDASKIALKNTVVSYKQLKPLPESEEDTTSVLPMFKIGDVDLEKIAVKYVSKPDGLELQTNIPKFSASKSELDLRTSVINAESLALTNSNTLLKMTKTNQKPAKTSPETSNSGFEWPIWIIKIDEIDFAKNNIAYINNNALITPGKFNADAIKLLNLELKTGELALKDKKLSAIIDNIAFEEASGLQLKSFETTIQFDEKQTNIENLAVRLNNNSLEGNLEAKYTSIDELINQPENIIIKATIPNFKANLSTAFYFQPQLKSNPYVAALSKKLLHGTIKANGKLSNIDIPNARVNWGNSTRIALKGRLKNATDVDNLYLSIPKFNIKSTKNDLDPLLTSLELGLNLPDNVQVTGNLEGTLADISADAKLESSFGGIQVKGNFQNTETIAFEASAETDSLAIGSLLQNPALGKISLKLNAKGSGSSVNTLDAQLKTVVNHFKYNDYTFKELSLQGQVTDGSGFISSDYKDDNLNATLNGDIQLDSISPSFGVDLDVKGADLEALGIYTREIKTGFDLTANFKGNSENYDAEGVITEGVAVYENKAYLMGDLSFSVHVTPDTTAIRLDNQMVKLTLESNASPVEFSESLNRHFQSYFSETDPSDTIPNPVNLKVKGYITQAPIMSEVFLVNLNELDTLDINIDFREKEHKLDASIKLPYAKYYSASIGGLRLSMNSDTENLDFTAGFQALSAGPLNIKQTQFSGTIDNNLMNLRFNSVYQQDTIVNIASTVKIDEDKDIVTYHVEPENLVVNSKPWQTSEDNLFTYKGDSLIFENFNFQRNGEKVNLHNKENEYNLENISFEFSNFDLSNFLTYLNPETKIASGNLNGNFALVNPFGKLGFLANLTIDSLKALEVDLGKLNLKGIAKGAESYRFDVALKEGPIDLDLEGNYKVADTSATIDVDLDLNEVQMKAISGLSLGTLKEGSGSFSGNFKMNGTTTNPEYKGKLQFSDAQFTVSQLNAPFILKNEVLEIDNSGFYFNNFNIGDTKGNTLAIDGSVGTESFINPTFDLSVKANNFKVLNSTEKDNDLFYGNASFDADARLTGDLNLPKLEVEIEVGKDTEITYVIPETELQMENRDGVVIFVNKENPDAILTGTEEKSYVFSGYDIDARLKVTNDAVINVVLNEKTNDNLQIKGNGDLRFNILPNGRTTLTGLYTLTDGHYELSLYSLVNRRFDIQKGSTVSWSGDPMNADLDATAIYNIETSAYGLMASDVTGANSNDQNQYRKKLPFKVYLYVNGELTKPELSFGLDMPESSRGSVNGNVYSKVQQINNQQNQLNKQVFSLLVLNRFYPDSGTSGANGGSMAIARDNLSQALSDQLNMFSDKLLGDTGVQLNFGVDSYTDYQNQGSQQRTDLNVSAQKKLFDDRLIVSVGSQVNIEGSPAQQETNPLIGNVSLEYLLTEDGKFRLRGFRRNQFENVIDGQLIVTGASLIYTEEFNRFQQLWKSLLRKEDEKEKEKKDESEDEEETQK